MAHTIDRFDGEFRFLSNFWPATVDLGNLQYPTVEHAYQAAKFTDVQTRARILACATPGQAKRLARKLGQPRQDWDSLKVEIMTRLVRQKFSRHPELAQQLLATGDATLIEGNDWGDRFWGQVRSYGQNNLGRILMQVRKELKEKQALVEASLD